MTMTLKLELQTLPTSPGMQVHAYPLDPVGIKLEASLRTDTRHHTTHAELASFFPFPCLSGY
jgi:hypothetical protein